MSVTSEIHWWQNAYTDRFQEYAPNYTDGDRITELIPIDTISQVPIAMLAGTRDNTCTIEVAREAADTIGNAVELFETFNRRGHGYFWTANDDCFVSHIVDLMQTHAEDAADSTVNQPTV